MKKEVQEQYWRALADSVGGELGEKVAEGMRELYSLYTPEMVDWFANLYDVKRGGYYYSNGARDNVKIYHNGEIFDLLPDAESTQQALRFICDSGLAGEVGTSWAKVMPEWMKDQIGRYIKGLQKPNGFFYHPQWSKEMVDKKLSRRARDLGWCTWILEHLGKLPTYDTPGGTKGDGLDYDGNPVAEKRNVLQVDGLVLDLEFKRCMVDGVEVKMAKKEFEILAYLISHRGTICSREQILGKVWKNEVVVLDRTIDVNITRVRNKIGAYGSYIVTRSGYGYGFRD